MIIATAIIKLSNNSSIEINKANLKSISSTISSRSDTKLPSYGIMSNIGNLEFNDFDGTIKRYAEELILTDNNDIDIFIENTLIKTIEHIGSFKTKDWDYDNNNRSVSVSLQSDLVEWQEIQLKGFSYDDRNPSAILPQRTMADLYKWLGRWKDVNGNYRTPEKYKLLMFDELDEKTKEILNNVHLKTPFLEDGSLWSQWTKLCQVCGLYIYKNKDGKTICSYTYGS